MATDLLGGVDGCSTTNNCLLKIQISAFKEKKSRQTLMEGLPSACGGNLKLDHSIVMIRQLLAGKAR
jgi:hypothetical protein